MLAVVLLYGALVAFRLVSLQGDWSAFIVAGSRFVRADVVRDIAVLQPSDGYDGQFYYRLALEPLTDRQMKYGIAIDDPRYRQQRILYPLLVNLLSFGNHRLVPSLMVLVNFAAMVLMGFLGALYARQHNRHALYGLAFPIYAGFFFSLSRDLAEAIELTCVLAALLCVSRRKDLAAALLISLAILAKETALLVAIGIMGTMILIPSFSGKRLRGFIYLIPLAVYASWQSWLNLHWHRTIAGAVQNNIGFPLTGIVGFIRSISSSTGFFERMYLVEIMVILIFTIAILFSLRTSTANLGVKVSWLLYGALIVSLTRSVWVEDWAFLRATTEFYVLGMAILISSPLPLYRLVVGLWSGLSLWVDLIRAPIV
jgi:hypothetical protein